MVVPLTARHHIVASSAIEEVLTAAAVQHVIARPYRRIRRPRSREQVANEDDRA